VSQIRAEAGVENKHRELKNIKEGGMKMSYLMTIQQDVDKFAKVIHDVLKVDVTIVDDNFVRVTGTGKFNDTIGTTIGLNTVFAKVLETGKSYFIDNPGQCELCEGCIDKFSCIEYAEVCCPIMLEGRAIGVIGLIAFEQQQKDALLENKKGLMEFLNQMADLISSRVLEGEMLLTNKLLRKQLETIIDSIDEGIIAIDNNGSITHCSYWARRIFDIGQEDVQGRNIEQLIPGLFHQIKDIDNVNNREIVLNKRSDTRVILSTRPITHNNSPRGTVLIIRTISDISKIINHVSGSAVNIYFEDIIGKSKIISDTKDKAIKASNGCSTILIMGESGTGKELFARSIHSQSSRGDKPFIAINCAAIPESLLESELFGYESGAFTGARKGGKIGKFELAKGGTIFLDEIGDMPLHLQAKLLRVLQDKTIERVGGSHSIALDVRIIAATHKDIPRMIDRREFREDLYYRLNVIPLVVPSLRERKEDILILMKHILQKANLKLNKAIACFDKEVEDIFLQYDWPGNIRELENAIEYAVNMENSFTITLGSIHQKFKNQTPCLLKQNDWGHRITSLRDMERSAIIKALELLEGDKEEAAKSLGISRATFYRKLKSYGIE
jgi:sigma-54 dependent transcriptional regulator, acetoin dehydrogenase operon transcriptional activator AcoR